MPKAAPAPPKFLQKKLEGKCLNFVKGQLSPFLDQVKMDKNGEWPSTTKLLPDFVEFMGKKDKVFKNIVPSTLVTTYDGVMHIYDLLRKRIATREGKTVLTSELSKEKPTPEKVTTRQSKQSQVKDKEPITQVTADYHGHGLDEKETPYRKEVNDEASSLGVSRTISDP